MRISEKFTKKILHIELNHNIHIYSEQITQIEGFINTKIYGRGASRLGYWKISITNDKNNVFIDILFKENTAKKVVEYASKLIDTCLGSYKLNEVWKQIIIK